MVELLTNIVMFLVTLGDKYPWLMWGLVAIGGLYVLLTVLQPLVLGVAKLTKTKKDNAFLARLYDVLTDWGPCFAPTADLFKKKTGYGGQNTAAQKDK